MSRKNTAIRRDIKPDIRYNNVLLAKFINNIMERGKKSVAADIVYQAFDRIKDKYKVDGFEVFNTAINNVKPFLEVTTVRVGGANYQVPAPVEERRGYKLATAWILKAASSRSEKSMSDKLAEELFEASNNRGVAIKKREDTHKMAESNKAFAHFIQKKSGAK